MNSTKTTSKSLSFFDTIYNWTVLNLYSLILTQGNVSSDLIIWDVQEKSSNIDALNGGGHIINSAAANQPSQSIAKVHNNINFAQTHIPSNEEQKSPAHNEYNEKQFGKTRQNILSATHQLPEVRYNIKNK